MKDIKTVKLDIRLTAAEKELIKKFAADHNLTMSELVRSALNQIIGGFQNDK